MLGSARRRPAARLARYRRWGGDLGIPGDILSEERFVRATYLSHLPKPADDAEAVAGVMGVIRNCQVPYGAPDNRGPIAAALAPAALDRGF
jgi:penicillin V acylase-like amidase (Ntn superfamily)